MNSYNLFRKLIVLGIITLFIGICFTPVTAKFQCDNKSVLIEKHVDKFGSVFFDRLIMFLMRSGHIPSLSTCIIKDDEVVWAKGYGLFDIEHNKKASEDTIYAVASISKTVTATALMQLYEQGFFELDGDINDLNNVPLLNKNKKHDISAVVDR